MKGVTLEEGVGEEWALELRSSKEGEGEEEERTRVWNFLEGSVMVERRGKKREGGGGW